MKPIKSLLQFLDTFFKKDEPLTEATEPIVDTEKLLGLFSLRVVITAIVTALVLIGILFLFSPFFHITEINLAGTSRVARSEVLERLNIDNSTNLIFFSTRAARARVMVNLYIGSVHFRRSFPRTIYIEVRERRLSAYIRHLPGAYLYIDDFGRVLEIRSYMTEPLPILEGLRIGRIQLGELLDVPDRTAFNAVVQYAQLLNQHGIAHLVSHMNVTDTNNIRILINERIEFNVGNVHRADEKIRWIVAIMESENLPNPDYIRGFVDLRDPTRSDIVFEPLM